MPTCSYTYCILKKKKNSWKKCIFSFITEITKTTIDRGKKDFLYVGMKVFTTGTRAFYGEKKLLLWQLDQGFTEGSLSFEGEQGFYMWKQIVLVRPRS